MSPAILVIDDEAGPRQSLRMILKDQYEVHLAAGAIEGLRLVEECRPDVVFLDIKMPEMDGTEVLRRIKALNADIEVAMITAYAAVDSAQHALRHGAIDYLTKPFAVGEVLGVVERALRRREEQYEQRVLLEQLQQATATLSDQLRQLREYPTTADEQTSIYQGLFTAHNSIESQLSNVARLASIGEIAAEVAHDVNNFLAAILLRIEMLLMKLRQPDDVQVENVEEALRDVLQATQDSAQAVERISALAKSDPYAPSQLVQVNDILSDAVELSAAQSPAAIEIVWETQEVPEVTGNQGALRTALMNVLINARQSIVAEGEIRLRTYPDDGWVVLEVSDNGVGMPSQVVERATDPFFTTKGEHGSGLGLSVTRKVVTQHGGSIGFESTPGAGTTVRIRLPIQTPEVPEDAPGAVPSVLVVDDDERLLALVEALLSAEGISVTTASSGRGGLMQFEEYLAKETQTPTLVITDLRMTDLMGTDLARQIKELVPETRVIMLSGYVSDEAELTSFPYLDTVMKKPFKVADLLAQVTTALESAAGSS